MYASPQYTHVPAASGFVGQGVLASPQVSLFTVLSAM